jgi:hypothetical protein
MSSSPEQIEPSLQQPETETNNTISKRARLAETLLAPKKTRKA